MGKSTLASALAKHIGATYLRVDTIEQALKDIYQSNIYDEGYQLAFKMAEDTLNQAQSVVGDSCNSVSESRIAWQQVAINLNIRFFNIEVLCSDSREHQHRVETRQSSIPSLTLPTWKQVQARDYQPWNDDIVRIDTAGKSAQKSIDELFFILEPLKT